MAVEQIDTSPAAPDATVEERLRALIDNLSSYIEFYHGGSVSLVSFDGKTARVRLGGACEGCALSVITLRGWVEGTVHQFFPDIHVEGEIAE